MIANTNVETLRHARGFPRKGTGNLRDSNPTPPRHQIRASLERHGAAAGAVAGLELHGACRAGGGDGHVQADYAGEGGARHEGLRGTGDGEGGLHLATVVVELLDPVPVMAIITDAAPGPVTRNFRPWPVVPLMACSTISACQLSPAATAKARPGTSLKVATLLVQSAAARPKSRPAPCASISALRALSWSRISAELVGELAAGFVGSKGMAVVRWSVCEESIAGPQNQPQNKTNDGDRLPTQNFY